jgi:hypothetical protein
VKNREALIEIDKENIFVGFVLIVRFGAGGLY